MFARARDRVFESHPGSGEQRHRGMAELVWVDSFTSMGWSQRDHRLLTPNGLVRLSRSSRPTGWFRRHIAVPLLDVELLPTS